MAWPYDDTVAGLDGAARRRIVERGNAAQEDSQGTGQSIGEYGGGALGAIIGTIVAPGVGTSVGWNAGKSLGGLGMSLAQNNEARASRQFVQGLTGGAKALLGGVRMSPSLIADQGVQAAGALEGAESVADAAASIA